MQHSTLTNNVEIQPYLPGLPPNLSDFQIVLSAIRVPHKRKTKGRNITFGPLRIPSDTVLIPEFTLPRLPRIPTEQIPNSQENSKFDFASFLRPPQFALFLFKF